MPRRPKPPVSKRQVAYAAVQRWIGEMSPFTAVNGARVQLSAHERQRLEVHIIAALNRWSDQQAKNRKKRAAR